MPDTDPNMLDLDRLIELCGRALVILSAWAPDHSAPDPTFEYVTGVRAEARWRRGQAIPDRHIRDNIRTVCGRTTALSRLRAEQLGVEPGNNDNYCALLDAYREVIRG